MTHTERQVLWVAGYTEAGIEPGGFMKALITAAFKADSGNYENLRLGFPDVIAAMNAYKAGKLTAGITSALHTQED